MKTLGLWASLSMAAMLMSCGGSGKGADGDGSSSGGASSCAASVGCLEKCVCATGDQVTCEVACAASSTGGTGGTSPATGGAGPGTGGAAGTGGVSTGGAAGAGGDPGTGGVGGDPGAGGAAGAPGNGVVIPGATCGGPNVQSPISIGGREVLIDYPCDRPPGTPVTFILNLHGTMSIEVLKPYIRGYFNAAPVSTQNDLVIATPLAIGSQWGRQDGGQDSPHLHEVIDWVYAELGAFDIRNMWMVGHSWGAIYARTFVCLPELSSRAAGVVLMAGGSSMPACSDRVSVLGTVGELDFTVPGELNQDAAAQAHGCGAAALSMLGNTQVTEWPSCAGVFVHKNYFMLGKAHGTDPVDWPEVIMRDDLVAAVVSTR